MQIHIILGITHFEHNLQPDETGVMADVTAASSDPIFINHHAMVDCILEEWLKKNKTAQCPQDSSIRRGHRQERTTQFRFFLSLHMVRCLRLLTTLVTRVVYLMLLLSLDLLHRGFFYSWYLVGPYFLCDLMLQVCGQTIQRYCV